MPDYDLVTDNHKINGLRKVELSLTVCLSQAGWSSAALIPDLSEHVPSAALLGTAAKAGDVSTQKWGPWPPLTLYWSTQVTWPPLTSKGQVHATVLCLRRRRTRNTGELHSSREHLDFFRIPPKDIFRAPSQCTSTCLKTQRENACCCRIFSCSNRLYFFPKLFFAVSCKTFPRGVTVIEILTLPGDSRRTKCSLVGVHRSEYPSASSIGHMETPHVTHVSESPPRVSYSCLRLQCVNRGSRAGWGSLLCSGNHITWVQNHHFLACDWEQLIQLLWASVFSAAKGQ